MSERQLLEDAAKMAGWKWWRSKHGYWNLNSPDGTKCTAFFSEGKFDQYTGEALPEPTPGDALIAVGFNPLNDNGQALELALKLNEFEPYKSRGGFRLSTGLTVEEQCLAIVRAAAEIGMVMP